jgi:hypothetical protein
MLTRRFPPWKEVLVASSYSESRLRKAQKTKIALLLPLVLLAVGCGARSSLDEESDNEPTGGSGGLPAGAGGGQSASGGAMTGFGGAITGSGGALPGFGGGMVVSGGGMTVTGGMVGSGGKSVGTGGRTYADGGTSGAYGGAVGGKGGGVGGGLGGQGGYGPGGAPVTGGRIGGSGGSAGGAAGSVPDGGLGGKDGGAGGSAGGAAGGGGKGGAAGNAGGIAGGGAGGGTPTGGTGGTGGCASLPPGVYDPIDDLDDGDRFLPSINGRAGSWSDDDDGSPGGVMYPDPVNPFMPTDTGDACRKYAAFVKGSGFSDWGADLRFGLGSPYDASGRVGISFLARIDGGTKDVIRVAFPDKDTHPDGGICKTNTTGPTACFDHYGARITLSSTWTSYTIYFASLSQDGWGLQGKAFDPSSLYEVIFQIPVNATFSLWIDNVAFIPYSMPP